MLKIAFGELGLNIENRISGVSDYFDANYENSWLSSDIAEQLVECIDLTKHVKDSYYESPVLGGISPRDLSLGSKGLLILRNEDDIVIRGEVFGDNCAEWLLKLAEIKDITISLHHVIDVKEPFNIYSINSKRFISSYLDYLEEIIGGVIMVDITVTSKGLDVVSL